MRIENTDIILERSIFPLIVDSDRIFEVLDAIEPKYFTQSGYREAWEAASHLATSGESINVVSLAREIRSRKGKLTAVQLSDICAPSKATATPDEIAQNLKALWEMRELEGLGRELTHQSRPNLVEYALDRVMEISLARTDNETKSIHEYSEGVVQDVMARVEARKTSTLPPDLLVTGIHELDNMGIFKTKRSIVIGGRPGMGKSSFAECLAIANAKLGYPVFFNPVEISPEAIYENMACNIGEIDKSKMNNGRLDDLDITRFGNAIQKLNRLPITFSNEYQITGILTKLKKWRMATDTTKPAIAIVDYIQNVSHPSSRINREERISDISRSLTLAAKSMNVCMIQVCQLSRAVETRGGDKRPQLSDLRESGQIEQDAHAVIFPYRPEYYGFELDDEGNDTKGLAEMIISKNRKGNVGIIKAGFVGMYGRFQNFVHGYQNYSSKASPINLPPINGHAEPEF